MYCLFCVVLFIVCVYMCTVLLPPGGYPFPVNKYIIYHITYYIISKERLSMLPKIGAHMETDANPRALLNTLRTGDADLRF